MRNVVFACACVVMTAASGAVVHVEANASADGDGSASRPYGSPSAALEGVRRDRASGCIDVNDSVLVLIGPGDYVLDATLAFGKGDGGEAWRGVE